MMISNSKHVFGPGLVLFCVFRLGSANWSVFHLILSFFPDKIMHLLPLDLHLSYESLLDGTFFRFRYVSLGDVLMLYIKESIKPVHFFEIIT